MKLLKLLTLTLFTLTFSQLAFSQKESVLKGTVTDESGTKKISGLTIAIHPIGTNNTTPLFQTVTGSDGSFEFKNIPHGQYTVIVSGGDFVALQKNIDVNQPEIDLGKFSVQSESGTKNILSDDIVPSITLNDDQNSDNQSGGDNNVSGILAGSRDVFLNTATFNFGQARWRQRGYDPDNYGVLINGIPMNDVDNGEVYWSNWGGLNDMFRFRDNSYGLEPTSFSFGEPLGASNTDATAARQRKELRVSYAVSNRSYQHRLMAAYSTGMMKGGWAVSVAGSVRLAERSYIPGTFYDSKAYFLSVSKKLGKKHILSFTAFGVPTRRGKSAPALQSVYDMMGTNFYNPNWGYQTDANGNRQVRNARVFSSHVPTLMLTHEWKINDKSSLNSAVGFQFGSTGNTQLNWFNTLDPRPDYYNKLPYLQTDSNLISQLTNAYQTNPNVSQINWDNMYEINRSGRDTVIDGKVLNQARYILENRLTDSRDFSFNTIYNNAISDKVDITAGLTYQYSNNRNYKVLADLLGADYHLDINQFAQRAFPNNSSVIQNNIASAGKLIKQGDVFGYDYNMMHHKAGGWIQAKVTLKKVEFFGAARLNYTTYWRVGNIQSGTFPNNSLGKSKVFNFINPSFKFGITYKINGRNFIFANGSYTSRAPYDFNIFNSPRTRNQTIDNVRSEDIYTSEFGYVLNAPRIKAKAVGYYSLFLHGIETRSYYHDIYQNFVNQTMTGIDRRYAGAELAIEGNIYKGFGVTAVTAIGRAQYISRPSITMTLDNSAEKVIDNQTAYLKNYYLGVGPQWANTISLFYNSPKFWFVRLNLNYYDRIFVDINPIRRTTAAVEGLDMTSDQYKQIIAQERLKGQFTMDLFAGYSWRLNSTFKNMKGSSKFLNFTLSVSNLLNNTRFVSSGFEQMRYDFTEKTAARFPNKYFYNYGINFFLNVGFRM